MNKYKNCQLCDVPNCSRAHFLLTETSNFLKVAVFLNDTLNKSSSSLYFFWCLVFLDIVEFKILNLPVNKTKEEAPSNFCNISFDRKALEMIKAFFIFCDPSVIFPDRKHDHILKVPP